MKFQSLLTAGAPAASLVLPAHAATVEGTITAPVPEPSTIALAMACGFAILISDRRSKRSH